LPRSRHTPADGCSWSIWTPRATPPNTSSASPAEEFIHGTRFPRLDVLPSHPMLAELQGKLETTLACLEARRQTEARKRA
jgi:hypothetical protein